MSPGCFLWLKIHLSLQKEGKKCYQMISHWYIFPRMRKVIWLSNAKYYCMISWNEELVKLKREHHTGLQTLHVLMKPYEMFAGRAVSIYVLFQLCKPYKNSRICNDDLFFLTICWLIRATTRLIICECFFTAVFSVWIIPVFSWCYGIFFRLEELGSLALYD